MVYLDNAATTYPKPPAVIREIASCMRDAGGNPGRGSHTMALRASETLYGCRCLAAELFEADEPECVCMTYNATTALNTAIRGLAVPGSHIIMSDMEHNSVRRPVEAMCREYGCTYDIFSTEGDADTVVQNARRLICKNTSVLVCLHSSNIINRVLPVRELGELCEKKGVAFILDASQSAGVYPISMARDKITALCMPGHKGLMGPQGTGLLILKKDIVIKPFMYGGSGVNSEEADMPPFLPDRLEAGTMCTPGAAGLTEGMRYVTSRGLDDIRYEEACLWRMGEERLRDMRFVRVYGDGAPGAIILFNIEGMSSASVASELDRRGICVRPGLHCSPLAHRTAGTPAGGAVRASVGPFTKERDIVALCSAVRDIAVSAGL